MKNLMTNPASYLAYYHTALSIDGENMHLGRASHVQVFQLPREQARPGITHVVRFYDGRYHRELPGTATLEQDGERVILQMGRGKVYRFVKQAAHHGQD